MQNHSAALSVTQILGGSLLSMLASLSDTYAGTIGAIIGFIIFLTGLGRLKPGLDTTGQSAVGLLTISAIAGAISAVIDLIPLMGWLANVGYIVAFGLELMGLLRLKNSASIGQEGKNGMTFLLASMGAAILASLIGLFPFGGGFIASFIGLTAVLLLYMGWTKVQRGMMEMEVA